MSQLTEEERLLQGARALVGDYIKIEQSDHVVIAYTPEAREVAARTMLELRTREIKAQALVMGVLKDETIKERLESVLPDPSTLPGRLVFVAMEQHTVSHTDVIPELLGRYPNDRVRQVQIINATNEILLHSFNATPEDISARNTALLSRLMGQHRIHITAPGGTDLTAELDSSKFVWISSRGIADRIGDVLILPAGEVATYPISLTGTLVADGAFSVNAHVESDTRLSANPVTLTIVDNVVTKMQCPDPDVEALLERLMSLDHGTEVGELGFGTNVGTEEFIWTNSFINERHPGVHVGVGQHNQGGFMDSRETPLHMDFIAPGAKVYIDDDPVQIDFDNIPVSCDAHPVRARVLSEDVETDCCGIRRGAAMRYVPKLSDLKDRAASLPL